MRTDDTGSGSSKQSQIGSSALTRINFVSKDENHKALGVFHLVLLLLLEHVPEKPSVVLRCTRN